MCISLEKKEKQDKIKSLYSSFSSPILLVVTLLGHLDFAFTFALKSGDLLAPSADDEAHHGIRDEDLLRGDLDGAAHKTG